MAPHRAARWLLFALLAGAPLGFALKGYLQWGSLLGLALLGTLLGWLELRRRPRDRAALVIGVLAAIGYVAVQGAGVHAARALVAGELARTDPGSRLLDVPLSAFPANPVCWTFVAIERNDANGTYAVRRGALSLAPWLTPVGVGTTRTAGRPARAARNQLPPRRLVAFRPSALVPGWQRDRRTVWRTRQPQFFDPAVCGAGRHALSGPCAKVGLPPRRPARTALEQSNPDSSARRMHMLRKSRSPARSCVFTRIYLAA
jgi:hypothetical protein